MAAIMPDPVTIAPHLRLAGRGALSNQTNRFEAAERTVFDDGWDLPWEPRVVRTEVALERPRTAITRNTSPDLGFDRSVNPTAAANMAASIALPGQATPIWACRPGWTLRRN